MANDMGDSDSKYVENRVELVDGLKYVEDIAEQLVLCGALPRIAVEKILLEYKTPDERNGELLDVVQKHCAYDIFAHCLLVSDQHELHELMVDKVGVQPVTDELTTLRYRVYCKDGRGVPKEIQVPPHIQKLLEEQRKALQRMENVERLVDLIEEEGCLTSETAREIKQPTDDKDKVNMLVDHMKELKLHSYFVLAMFLDISQKKDLLKEITDESSRTALQRMDDLRLKVYYNQLGTIALQDSELEARLGITAREFVTLRINSDSNAVDRRGFSEAHVDQSKAKEIKLTDLFSDQEYKEPTKKVLLIGAPGTGKTSATAQLARDATTKKALNIPRPPFIILLRSIEWKNHTSLKKLLVNHGPKLKETVRDEVWEALSKHADDVTVILDGADEVPGGFFKRQAGQVAGEESEALPRDILNNLISGKLLKGARVLVSTRPFGLDSCWDNFSRKVEVVGFNKKSLHRFLSNELPEKIKEVQSFLATHVEVKSLLLIPLNAATFVLRAKNPQHTDNWLLQSRTELSLSLIDTLVKTMLRKDHGGSIPRVDLKKPGKNLRKLSKHVAELLYSKGAVKTEMTSEDLEKAEISVDECVATGVFSEQVVDEDGVSDSILIVPHQSILESLAALGLEEQQILKLVADNDGRHDLVLTYVAGILGNERNRKMLEYVLIEEDKEKDFKKLAETVVRAILGSKRRLLRYDGEEFCQRIVVESQQWDFIADLMALSERRAACHLNHLRLCLCDLSSSSSSGRHVNSSELSDVITRHSSISTLTLLCCKHFTPDVMSHLSSSMTAITKLYISPYPFHRHYPFRPSDVASLVHASRGLKQLWLNGVHDELRVSDYMEVIDAINASPALRVVGLDVEKLTVDEVRDVVRAMTRRLTRLWLKVDYRKMEVCREVVLEKEPGVVQLVESLFALYPPYVRESGSFLQHLPPSLPDHFRW